MSRPPEIKNLTSSGGVIARISAPGVEVVLISVGEQQSWCLPKGIIDKGESPPEAALREVREETGLSGELTGKIGDISYWFSLNDGMLKVHKTVHLYLLKYISGSTNDHDHEVNEARWFMIDEAINMLAHKSEREILQKARGMIEERLDQFQE